MYMNDNYKYKYMKYKKMYLDLKNQSGGFEETEDFNNSIYSESEYMGGFKRNHQQTGGRGDMSDYLIRKKEDHKNEKDKHDKLKIDFDTAKKEKNEAQQIMRLNLEWTNKVIKMIKNYFDNKNKIFSEESRKITQVRKYFDNEEKIEFIKKQLNQDVGNLFKDFPTPVFSMSKNVAEEYNNNIQE